MVLIKTDKNMKRVVLVLITVMCFMSIVWSYFCVLNTDNSIANTTQINFNQTEIDMGQLQQSHPQTVSFKFTNTGEYPLVIQRVETSCGCTEPVWPNRPIKPGDSSVIKVTYDAKYPGRFVKSITVFCNSAKGKEELLVKGEVAVSE